MKRKTWSYRQVTAAAEKEIRALMTHATTKEDAHDRRLYRSMAYGVLNGWAALTGVWRERADYDRLNALIEQNPPPNP